VSNSSLLHNELARPLGVKGLGPISAFWPITSKDFKPLAQGIGLASRYKGVRTDFNLLANHYSSEDFKPLTQRIGPASRCKAALSVPPLRWASFNFIRLEVSAVRAK
jgi:hypothetical protein